MSATLEVALLFLIIALIIVLGFVLKLIIDSIKLVKNLDETTTILKNEIEPTLQELTKTLENLNSLTNDADKKFANVKKLLSGFLGLSSVALGGVKNLTGGLIRGIIAGIKMFNQQ